MPTTANGLGGISDLYGDGWSDIIGSSSMMGTSTIISQTYQALLLSNVTNGLTQPNRGIAKKNVCYTTVNSYMTSIGVTWPSTASTVNAFTGTSVLGAQWSTILGVQNATPPKRKAPWLDRAPTNHRGLTVRSAERSREFDAVDTSEMVALQLLRKMLNNQDAFRKYLRHGFVIARGSSGLEYQIDRNDARRIVVRDRGEIIAWLCVHVRDGATPPSDRVVAKVIIVECDEVDIWRRANVTWALTTSGANPQNLQRRIEQRLGGGVSASSGRLLVANG